MINKKYGNGVLPLMAVLASIFFPSGAGAEGKLDLERCLELAAKNNIALAQQEEMLALAEADIRIQKAGLWPSIRFESSAAYTSELPRLEIPALASVMQQGIGIGVRDKYDLSLELTVPVFTGFRTGNLVRSAEERLRMSENGLIQARNAVFLRVHQLFHTLEANLFSQDVMMSSIRRMEDHLRLTKSLLDNAQATPYDTLEMSNRLLGIRTDLLDLRRQFRTTAAELANMIGVDRVDSIEPGPDPDETAALGELPQYEALAMARRPELSMKDNSIREQEFQKKAIRSSYFPQVYAGSSFHYANPGVNFFGDDWMDYYTFGIQLEWQLWEMGRRRSEVRRIDHAIAISRMEKDSVRDDIRQQVISAYEQLTTDSARITLQRRLVDQERERYRIVSERYAVGMATAVDLADAEESLTSAELSLRRLLAGFMMDRAAMEYATGGYRGGR